MASVYFKHLPFSLLLRLFPIYSPSLEKMKHGEIQHSPQGHYALPMGHAFLMKQRMVAPRDRTLLQHDVEWTLFIMDPYIYYWYAPQDRLSLPVTGPTCGRLQHANAQWKLISFSYAAAAMTPPREARNNSDQVLLW